MWSPQHNETVSPQASPCDPTTAPLHAGTTSVVSVVDVVSCIRMGLPSCDTKPRDAGSSRPRRMTLTAHCRLRERLGARPMHLGHELKDAHCARCYERLTPPALFRDGGWYHARCSYHGTQQLANATRISNALHPLDVRHG